MSQKKQNSYRPEIWGGIECTISRTGDEYYDQLQLAGHYDRDSDLRQLAELGIKALRYPVLWERHQPRPETNIDWTWADRGLHRLRQYGITPIVGLLHHGSGPGFTDLSSPNFAENLAAYADLVAERFPWIEYYTPVNEPLTTARFSGLYGLWYPHCMDALQFMSMLLHQVKGIVLSMTAIRKVNPLAKLVQTEDLCYVHSTPGLAYQADFENQRRWLTYDLLCGKVDHSHTLWGYLSHIGVKEADLSFFLENPCIPDTIGVNYYVTSERYLDETLDKYPISTYGGNNKQQYADVIAVRVVQPAGLAVLLEEVWRRYKIPIAITETHINCTREQQLRWLKEIWVTACDAKQQGLDVQAVTSWALLGAYDWNSLLTRHDGCYESGAYTITEGRLQLTAVGTMIKSLAQEGDFHHPLLDQPGWWHSTEQANAEAERLCRPLIIAGTAGFNALWRAICQQRGISVQILCVEDYPCYFYWSRLFEQYDPWCLIIEGDPLDGHGALLSEISSELELPCLSWEGSRLPDVAAAQCALDKFIDLVLISSKAAIVTAII